MMNLKMNLSKKGQAAEMKFLRDFGLLGRIEESTLHAPRLKHIQYLQ